MGGRNVFKFMWRGVMGFGLLRCSLFWGWKRERNLWDKGWRNSALDEKRKKWSLYIKEWWYNNDHSVSSEHQFGLYRCFCLLRRCCVRNPISLPNHKCCFCLQVSYVLSHHEHETLLFSSVQHMNSFDVESVILTDADQDEEWVWWWR